MPGQPEPELLLRQRRFFALLCDPQPLAAALLTRAQGDAECVPIRSWLEGESEDDARRRLEIYRAMRQCRLTEALREDFASAYRLLGAARFDALVQAYFAATPSQSPSLRGLGARLPEFVRGQLEAELRPDLYDLCALDWARLTVFDLVDAEPLAEPAIAALPADAWDRFKVRLVPAHAFVRTVHRVESVWVALDRGEPVPEAQTGAEAFLVWKRRFEVRHAALEPHEHAALTAAAAGLSLSALCECLAVGLPAELAGPRVFAALQQWLVNGWLVADG